MNDQNKIVDENIFLKQPPNPLFIWDLVYLCNNVSIFVKATLYFSLIILLMWKKILISLYLKKKSWNYITYKKRKISSHLYRKILFFDQIRPFSPFWYWKIVDKKKIFFKIETTKNHHENRLEKKSTLFTEILYLHQIL